MSTKSPAKPQSKVQITKEVEMLLQDSSRKVSTKSSALFYGNALIVAAIPIWIFWRIHQMEPLDYYIYFALATLVCTYLISMAYKNVKFVLKHKIAQKREEAIIRDVNAKLAAQKDGAKKDRDDKILWKKNEVADYEATTFSIFYNNSLFLIILLIASFVIFKNFSPLFNYFLSMGVSAGLLALFSTGTK